MTTDFSSFDFAQGSVSGIRAWRPAVFAGPLPSRQNFEAWSPPNWISGDPLDDSSDLCLVGAFSHSWYNEHKTAMCHRSHFNRPGIPHPECTCGIYAYWSNDGIISGSHVAGVIEGSGRTIIGTQGFRTEHAKIVALAIDFASYKSVNSESIFPKENQKLAFVLAKRYKVPFYSSIDTMLSRHPLTTGYEELSSSTEARSDSTEARSDSTEAHSEVEQ